MREGSNKLIAGVVITLTILAGLFFLVCGGIKVKAAEADVIEIDAYQTFCSCDHDQTCELAYQLDTGYSVQFLALSKKVQFIDGTAQFKVSANYTGAVAVTYKIFDMSGNKVGKGALVIAVKAGYKNDNGNVTKDLKTATLSVQDIKQTTSTKDRYVSLKLTTNSNGKKTYVCADTRIKVSKDGKVKIPKNFVGTAKIMVTTEETSTYAAATDEAVIVVKPANITLKKALHKKNSTKMKISWKKASNVDGYQIQYCTDDKFTNCKTVKVNAKLLTSKTVNGLTSNKGYFVRIRSYKSCDGTTYYSDWSAAKFESVK